MADSVREQIIKKIIARAAAIKIASGYLTDIGTNVERAAAKIDPDDLGSIIIWPGNESSVKQFGKEYITMSVRIEGIVLHGAENTSVMSEKVLGDLRKAFTDPKNKTTVYAALVDDHVYTSGGNTDYASGGEKVSGGYIEVDYKYYTAVGNPYSA